MIWSAFLTPLAVCSPIWLLIGAVIHVHAIRHARRFDYEPILLDVFYWYAVGGIGGIVCLAYFWSQA